MKLFELYRGWSFESAIRDIMNSNIQQMKTNLYPKWFNDQFKLKIKKETK
jgi:hypothetical protein